MDRLTTLVREALKDTPPGPFYPCAFCLDGLDTIMVITRNCSYCEIPKGRTLSILEDNYPETEQEKRVGLFLHFAKPFCEKHRLINGGRVPIGSFLKAVTVDFPDIKQSCKLFAKAFDAMPAHISREIWWLE